MLEATTYAFEKVYQGLRNIECASFGKDNFDLIKKLLSDFKEDLDKRDIGIEAYPGVKETYKQLEYPLQKLEEAFNCLQTRKELNIDIEAALIFTWFMQAKIEELEKMAKEIDEDYSIRGPITP